MIYHVVPDILWQLALQRGVYEAGSLASEGFIHASDKDQVKGVIARYYKDRKDLLVLHIDESLLKAALKYELAPSVNEWFPHIYGSLNIDAVIKATPYDKLA